MFVHQGRELEQGQFLQPRELGHRLVVHSWTGGLAAQALLAAPVLLVARPAGAEGRHRDGDGRRPPGRREKESRTHLLGWDAATCWVLPSTSSSSSSECCTSRWMWPREEGQGEAAEEPGESWDEEDEEEEEAL